MNVTVLRKKQTLLNWNNFHPEKIIQIIKFLQGKSFTQGLDNILQKLIFIVGED